MSAALPACLREMAQTVTEGQLPQDLKRQRVDVTFREAAGTVLSPIGASPLRGLRWAAGARWCFRDAGSVVVLSPVARNVSHLIPCGSSIQLFSLFP